MKEREAQFQDLGREYREKLEQVKFERERIALKEEQFLRQIQKNETEKKQELQRLNQRYGGQMHSKKREFDQKLEDMEDRLSLAQDERDDYSRQVDKLSRENHDLKRQVDSYA